MATSSTPPRPLRRALPRVTGTRRPLSGQRITAALSTLLDLYEAYDFGGNDQHAISRTRDLLHAVQDGTIEDEL